MSVLYCLWFKACFKKERHQFNIINKSIYSQFYLFMNSISDQQTLAHDQQAVQKPFFNPIINLKPIQTKSNFYGKIWETFALIAAILIIILIGVILLIVLLIIFWITNKEMQQLFLTWLIIYLIVIFIIVICFQLMDRKASKKALIVQSQNIHIGGTNIKDKQS